MHLILTYSKEFTTTIVVEATIEKVTTTKYQQQQPQLKGTKSMHTKVQ